MTIIIETDNDVLRRALPRTMTETTTTPCTQIDPDAMGVELSWSFGNGDAEAVTMDRQVFIDILHAHGFQFCLGWRGREEFGYLKETSPAAALRKAQHTVKGRTKTIVIQELRRPNKDTARAFGVYRVSAALEEGESGDDVLMMARVRVEGDAVRCLPPEGDTIFVDDECERIGHEIARIATSLIDNVINLDISACLSAIGWAELSWVSRRRNSGGVYFAARNDTTERYVAMLQAIAAESHKVDDFDCHFVPQIMEVYPKPLSMDMWKGATADQFTAQTTSLMAKLEVMRKGKMRDNTIEAHSAECDRLMVQAESHRLLLADQVEEIQEVLTSIRVDFQKALDEDEAPIVAIFDAIGAPEPKAPRRRRKRPAAPVVLNTDNMTTDEAFGAE